MSDVHEIKVFWKQSEEGSVCIARAISREGKVLEEASVICPSSVATEFFRVYGGLAKDEIEKGAQEEVRFKLRNPTLFK